jgi:hypothetical protein
VSLRFSKSSAYKDPSAYCSALKTKSNYNVSLEVDRKDGKKEYSSENCVVACHLHSFSPF